MGHTWQIGFILTVSDVKFCVLRYEPAVHANVAKPSQMTVLTLLAEGQLPSFTWLKTNKNHTLSD